MESVSQEEAKNEVAGSIESEGPHVIVDRADALHGAMSPNSPMENPYLAGRIALTFEEVQGSLGIGERTLRTAMRNGEIPSVKVGGRRLFPVRALERHLEALAYAGSGALDAWESALVKATTVRLKTARRRALERRKYLRRKLAEARKNGLDTTEIGQDHVATLRADLATLRREGAISEAVAKDMSIELDQAER